MQDSRSPGAGLGTPGQEHKALLATEWCHRCSSQRSIYIPPENQLSVSRECGVRMGKLEFDKGQIVIAWHLRTSILKNGAPYGLFTCHCNMYQKWCRFDQTMNRHPVVCRPQLNDV